MSRGGSDETLSSPKSPDGEEEQHTLSLLAITVQWIPDIMVTNRQFRHSSPFPGSYGTIDLSLMYDDVNLLLVVNVLKARVSQSPLQCKYD